MEFVPMQTCEVCDWTAEGEIPDRRPLCSATREQFHSFEQDVAAAAAA